MTKKRYGDSEARKILERVFGKIKKEKGRPMVSARLRNYDPYEDDEDYEFDIAYKQWSSSDGTIFFPIGKTVRKLKPGVYEINTCQQGLYFEKIPVRTEGLIKFPDTKSEKVVKEVQNFWEREEVFRKYDLTYKRGVMLYGPPGSGKSCTVQLIMADVVQRGGIVIEFHRPDLFIDGLRKLRKIQPDCPVVAVMEDIDALLEMNNESEILNILDGVNEVDKVVFLATTNYPDKLGHRIINRPSRFDKRFKIGFPSEASRRVYFEHLIGKETAAELDIDLEQWVKDTDKFSIAHLKELFVAVVILEDKYKDAIKTLSKMKEEVKDKDFEEPMGFGKDESNPEDYD
jgi:hypothetical protein